jgi:hypothetical protein
MDVRLRGFGSIEVEGRAYEHDIVIDQGAVRKRSKKPSVAGGRCSVVPITQSAKRLVPLRRAGKN